MGRSLPCLPFAFLFWISFTQLSTPLSSSFVDFSTHSQQLDHAVSTTRRRTGTSLIPLSTASSLPNLSFRKKDECTSSVSSLLATASLSTACAESIVGGNDDGSVLFSSCINYTVIPHAPTALKLTTEPYDQFCCGLCTIQYPQAVLYHWPARRTNTWCDQIRSTLKSEGVAYGGEGYPQPTIDPSIYQNAMGLDPEIGGADALDNDGNLRAAYTHPPQSGAYAVAKDGFVFISPSVYVVFPIILATNNCGLVGNAYTSWTLGVPEHQLSTYQEYYGIRSFNPADLGCPHPLEDRDLDDPGLTEAAEGMDPSVLLPADLTDLDPAWKSCSLLPLGLGRDPPRTLEPASNMAPRATSSQASPTTTRSVPYPHSLPKSPGPDPTSSSLPTEGRPFSAPENTVDVPVARLQKPPSVCAPILRSHTGSSNVAKSPPPQPIGHGSSSQHPDIGPRNEAASHAKRSLTSGMPLSGTALDSALASYLSGMQAWADGMDSEASAGQLPPVAASNPYMALPKQRSAKRSRISTMTRSPFSQNSSEMQATSKAMARPAPEILPLLSATYQSKSNSPSASAPANRPGTPVTHHSTPRPPTAKAPVSSPGTPPPQSAPPEPPDPKPKENESVQKEDCNQDIVVNLAITTRIADTDLSPSVPASPKSASLAPLPTQKIRVSSSDLHEASSPASSLSGVKTVTRGLPSAAITPASASSYASFVASVMGLPTTTASSGSAEGPRTCVVGSGSLWWIGFGFLLFAALS